MTLSVISTNSTALSAGLPFAVNPDDCTFAILLSQEPSGSLSVVQSSGGTLLSTGTGSSGGTSSVVTLAAGTANVGTFALSTGATLAVSGTFWQATQPVSGTMSIAGTPTVALSAGNTLAVSIVGGTVTTLPSAAGTQAVSGTLALSTGNTVTALGNFWQTTQPVSVATLPLPTGAATASGVGSIVTALGSPLQAGGNIGNTAFGAVQSGVWTVGLSAGQTITLGGSNTVTLAAGSASVGTVSLASNTFTLAAGNSSIGTVAFAASSSVTLSAGTSNVGSVTLAAGTSNIGTIAGSSANIPVYLAAVSSGGASLASFTNAASSSLSGTIKASSGQLMAYDISNSGTTGAWVRFYAAATETVGAGTPVLRLYVPPTSARAQGVDLGAVFSTGIVVTATAGAADSDTSTFAIFTYFTRQIGTDDRHKVAKPEKRPCAERFCNECLAPGHCLKNDECLRRAGG